MPLKRKTENTRIKLTPAQKEAIYAWPLPWQFRIVHTDAESGCAVYRHVLADPFAKDYEQVFAVAKAYAKECDCWINPVIVANERVGRARIFPGIDDNANPDLTTEKYGYVDVKSPLNKNNIVINANKACKQNAIAVITDLMLENEVISVNELNKFTGRIFSEQNKNRQGKTNYTKDEIHWYINGRLYKCNRPEENSSPSA